jgi:hypothetical protein
MSCLTPTRYKNSHQIPAVLEGKQKVVLPYSHSVHTQEIAYANERTTSKPKLASVIPNQLISMNEK